MFTVPFHICVRDVTVNQRKITTFETNSVVVLLCDVAMRTSSHHSRVTYSIPPGNRIRLSDASSVEL